MIGINIDTSDIEKVLEAKVQSDAVLMKALHKAHMKAVEDLSQKYVPRGKSGKLADSMKSSTFTTPTSSVGVVSYNTDYAARVHERHGGYNKGERKRFLYKALNETYPDRLLLLKEGVGADE